MTLTDDFTLKCMKGSPVFLDDICAIYPRKLGDIVDIGYSTFLKYINLFNMEKPSSQEVKDNDNYQFCGGNNINEIIRCIKWTGLDSMDRICDTGSAFHSSNFRSWKLVYCRI